VTPDGPAGDVRAELQRLPVAEARRRIAARVQRSVADFLGLMEEDVAPDATFLDLGFDSLRAVDFKDELAERFGCELRTTLVFDHPTPKAVTEHLLEVLGLAAGAASVASAAADDLESLSADELRERLRALEHRAHEPIAIVGAACRLPGGSDSPDAYWALLSGGGDAVGEIPAERFPIDAYFDPDHRVPGKIATRYGAFLSGIDRFDARFFGMSPREARELDPRQRILMETAWEALERGGISADRLRGRAVGVYLGILSHEYYDSQTGRDLAQCGQYNATGAALSTAAGRLSHHLGWTGPSIALDTACSSSLVALHLAVRSIRGGECELALVAGVNALLDPVSFLGVSQANMLAADGRCKTFDAKGDGYVRAEGCGAVLLKPLSRARADGDRVFGVVLGTASNQDGASGGLTVPHGPSQVAVVRAALADARVEPGAVSYVEAHGTGTSLGDPIEINALDEVFGASHGDGLLVGSVKTNIGHSETVAGIAGVLKIAVALEHGAIPRNLHFETPNPHVAWERSVVRVPTKNVAWPAGDVPRIAGISSFGFSGTNAHAVLADRAPGEAGEAGAASGAPRLPLFLPLSAASPEALDALIERHADALPDEPAACADHCATTLVGRAALPHRAAFVAGSPAELADQLRGSGLGARGDATGRAPRVAFLFTGQGSQLAGMARGLYDAEPAFRAALDACAAALAPHLDRPLFDVLWGDDAAELIDRTHYTQPALFAVEVALARMWRAFGVEPTVLLGHSIGEIAAAHVAGVFSLEDASKLVAARGRLMTDRTEPGDMLAVLAPEDRVAPFLAPHAGRADVAAANGPANTVISGAPDAVAAVARALADAGITATPLAVSRAFHSALMEPMLAAFGEVARSIEYGAPRIPIRSCVDARVLGPECATPQFWVDHVRKPVRFQAAVEALLAPGADEGAAPDVLLELGPQPILLGMARRFVGDAAPAMIPALRRGPAHANGDWSATVSAAAELFARGVPLDGAAIQAGDPRRRATTVPTYPFQRERFWYERRAGGIGGAASHPLLGARATSALLPEHAALYRSTVTARAPELLGEHVVFGRPIFPAAGLVEMALAAAGAGDAPLELTGLAVREALAIGERETALEVVVDAPSADAEEDAGARAFRICSLGPPDGDDGEGGDEAWTVHATGRIAAEATDLDAQPLDPTRFEGDGWTAIEPDEFYAAFAAAGLDYGPAFRGIRELRARRGPGASELGEAFARIRLDGDAAGLDAYRVHPALLDACFQTAAAALVGADVDDLFLPIGIERVRLRERPGAEVWCRTVVTLGSTAERTVRLDVRLYARRGSAGASKLVPVFEALGLSLVRADAATLARADDASRRLLHAIEWQPAGPSTASEQPPTSLALVGENATAAALRAELERRGVAVDADASAVAFLAGVDAAPGDEARLCAELAELVRMLVARGDARLAIVTRGAQPAGGRVEPAGAALWGFANALALEHPELRVRRVDLDPALDREDSGSVAAEAGRLADELLADDDEDRVALRGAERRAPRLARLAALGASHLTEPQGAYELRARAYGSLDHLELRPLERRAPEPGEVEVEIDAAALNFKDVLHVLGMLREWSEARGIERAPDQPLGFEAAGRVVRVGDEHAHDGPRVGDRVIVSHEGLLATHATVPIGACMPEPAGLDAAQAAGIPTVFQTALYALERCAKLKRGERVLIHAAAGGVGQAALQVARRAGAEVFATASPGKHAFLRGQGVRHVFNSRTLSFADEVRAATGGEGVDVVLNSLKDDFVDAGLACLKRGGRFVEIGKIGVKTPDEMAAARPDVGYFLFDLSETLRAEPTLLGELRDDVGRGFASGDFHALPTTRVPAKRAVEAFRDLAQARRIGKIALVLPAGAAAAARRVRPDRTVLVTGGLGALGRVVAGRLAEMGAGAIALCGRRGEDGLDEAAAAELSALRESGANVRVFAADVGRREDVARVLADIARELPPLGGVVHCAGVLDDATVLQLEPENVARVFAPKVAGLRNLDELTRELRPELFVAFSSMAAPLGAQGQAAYGAANAVLDAICAQRAGDGLPALSIQWGPWSGGGMAASLSARNRERLAERGLGAISPAEGGALFGELLSLDRSEVAVLPIRWPKFLRAFPRGGPPPLFAAFATAPAASDEHSGLREALDQAAPEDRATVLAEFLERQLVRVLGFPASTAIDPRKGFTDLGVDSLLAVDLRGRLESSLDAQLPATLLFDHPNLEALVAFLAERFAALMTGEAAGDAAGAEDAAGDARAAAEAELAELSEDEIAARLAAEIDALSTE